MKARFVEWRGDYYVVVGLTTKQLQFKGPFEYVFEVVVLDNTNLQVARAMLSLDTFFIPIKDCREIENVKELEMLILLYG